MRVVALALTMLMMVATPAAAGTPQDPEMVDDHCGFAETPEEEVTLPWLDLCSVWFETVESDVPTIKVTMEVGDDLQERTKSTYWVAWEAGDCRLQVQQHDDGHDVTPAASVAMLHAHCAEDSTTECQEILGATTCTTEWHYRTEADISSGYSEDGNRLTWVVRLDGELARYASRHEPGDVLRPIEAYSASAVAGFGSTGAGFCRPSNLEDPLNDLQCVNYVAERIWSGRDYVVGS